MLDWSLVSGAVPIMLIAAGGAALLGLLFARRDRRWWIRTVPMVVLIAAAAVGVTAVALVLWRPFPDSLPTVVWCSLGGGLAGVGLAIAAARPPGWRRRAGVAVAAVLVLLAAANLVNWHFGQFPTVRTALGLPMAGQVDFSQVSRPAPTLTTRSSDRPLSQTWHPPPGMPSTGAVSEVAIPAPVSHFAARPGWIYLPSAYLTLPRARLPVLVLVSGQPSNPRDWLDGGRLAAVLDRFAAAHAGLAPVVVIPDALGAPLANPLCLNSRLGNAQTYLTVDVPGWIRTHLQVDPDPGSWAVGGYSAGGTCALQLAVTAPAVYPTFIDISGQAEPTLGDRTRTVAAAFGGDTAAFTAVNPLNLLATHRYPGSAGTIVVGNGDTTFRPQAQQMAEAGRRAGMQITYRELPGGHDWRVWGLGLQTSLPWLATRLHLIPGSLPS